MAMEGDVAQVGSLVTGGHLGNKTGATMETYSKLFQEDAQGGEKKAVQARKKNYTSMVNQFYDLVTDFYEFGWGQSFHFAPRHKWESFAASIARHEFFLANALKLGPGKKALDVGCGVGGPQRAMARFSQAHITGLNNNANQIERAKAHSKKQGLAHLCSYTKADFMKIPHEDETFDAVYQIEATCHAPDKVGVFSEMYRVLKPGGIYAGYEWVITDKYDANNPEHVSIKKGIEVGNGLPELEKPGYIRKCLEKAGFEILEDKDLAPHNPEYEIPWYDPLAGSFSIAGFKHTWLGRYLTNRMVAALELCRIAPNGTTAVSNMLMKTAIDLVNGGKTGTFSPMHFFVAVKR